MDLNVARHFKVESVPAGRILDSERRVRNLERAIIAISACLASELPPAGADALEKIAAELFTALPEDVREKIIRSAAMESSD